MLSVHSFQLDQRTHNGNLLSGTDDITIIRSSEKRGVTMVQIRRGRDPSYPGVSLIPHGGHYFLWNLSIGY